jgi:excisionase family DNA binding protein
MTPQWISVEEAARRLGVSVSTIRRRIEAGELEAERELIGGARERFKVRLTTPRIEQPQDTMGEASLASESTPALAEGLLLLVREMRQQGVNDASRIEALIERAARAEAASETHQARIKDLEAQLAAERAEAERRRERWFRWWPW